ncbi:hypothetical protein Pcinc_032025 [Petrolisthes cinctipes]|uniref:Neuroparsin n=1 Tax=Petrolisthes cinctipes TaxID=88211 RepID=A0AAE1EV64_PETCI|nr:hypothetical protein Pcinc_032025 [Petrolisthes cinctipes]
MKSSVYLISTILFLIVVVFLNVGMAAPRCETEGNIRPDGDCKYGTVLDWCRNVVCAKGPGETCGDEWWERGQCTPGTYCACGRCHGCSANLECHFC